MPGDKSMHFIMWQYGRARYHPRYSLIIMFRGLTKKYALPWGFKLYSAGWQVGEALDKTLDFPDKTDKVGQDMRKRLVNVNVSAAV